jgi:hypothetical protein
MAIVPGGKNFHCYIDDKKRPDGLVALERSKGIEII